jgi:DNA-binding transcriptional LysR family regulator
VERGQRFHDFTPDGERVLRWATVILDNWSAMQQEIGVLRGVSGALTGRLSIGVIPSALPIAALLAKAIDARHPGVDLTVLSQSSIEILRNLQEFSIDVGVTYLDNEPIEGMRAEPIYEERYCLLVRSDHDLAQRASVTWAEAGRQSLCLLTSDMQHRRIVDRAFRAANVTPQPRLETNSVINLWANVRLMGLASILPEHFPNTLGPTADVRAIPLTDPHVQHAVGLVAVARELMSPLVLAAFDCAPQVESSPT